MREIKYNIPVYEDEDIADLKEYSEKMAEAIKVQVDKFGNPLVFKGTVPTLIELQAIAEATNGDIYSVSQENKNYIWNGTEWKIYSDNSESINTTSDIIVSPTEPQTDRRKVWLQKGKNLFNGNIVDGYGLNEDGTTYISSHRAITEFISITSNCSYCFSGATFKMVCVYDKDKNFISSLNGSVVYTFSAPSNAKYVRLVFDNTVDYSNLQVEYGTEETEYEPYANPTLFVKNDNGKYEEFIKKEEDVIERWKEPATGFKYRKIKTNVEMNIIYAVNKTLASGEWLILHTLPVEFRPETIVPFPVILRITDESSYIPALGQILKDGTVRVSQRTGLSLTVDQVNFSAMYTTLQG